MRAGLNGWRTRLLIVGWIACLASQTFTGGTPEPADVSLTIQAPEEGAAVVGDTTVDLAIAPTNPPVQHVVVLVDGFELCRRDKPPWSCRWDAGPTAKEHHVRVVATLEDGSRLVANRRTRSLAVTESVRVTAVQVPVLVTNAGGGFERHLKKEDFTLFEDGQVQEVDSVFDDSLPLELVIAVDISASMEAPMSEVRDAVRRLLSHLRPEDAATLVGFNDTLFVLTERETEPELRDAAVEALVPWGGTALYDATIRAVELVGRQPGRRGVIVFSDGDDRHSVARREDALARIEEAQVLVYTIGFGKSDSARYRGTLEAFARASGARAFFSRHPRELDAAFASILEELSHQFVLSYVSNATDRRNWRRLDVKARCDGCRVRAREGYRVSDP